MQWESSRQSCCSLSTAEAELHSYLEAMVMADSLAGIIQELEGIKEVDGNEETDAGNLVHRVIYGDNMAA